jgi:hypothetical protein|nr:MAG TPA: hypothetical protein [Caudoviricetes sp.]
MKKGTSIKFPQYVSGNARAVSVVGYITDTNFNYEDGKGYLDDDGYVWIFCKNGKPKNSDEYPYFWIEDENIIYSIPDDEIRDKFNIDNMIDISLVNIIEKTKPNEVLYDEQEIQDMNSAASFYVPIINDSDDFLKKIVKNTIITKGIDINRLKGKTDQKYVLPNMKAALENKTKMSVIYFCCWMELLGCDFQIDIIDNGLDSTNKLKTDLIYTSNTDKVYKSINGDLVECINKNTEGGDDNEVD